MFIIATILLLIIATPTAIEISFFPSVVDIRIAHAENLVVGSSHFKSALSLPQAPVVGGQN